MTFHFSDYQFHISSTLGIRTVGSSNGSSELERVDVQIPASVYDEIYSILEKDSIINGPYIPVITGFIGERIDRVNDDNRDFFFMIFKTIMIISQKVSHTLNWFLLLILVMTVLPVFKRFQLLYYVIDYSVTSFMSSLSAKNEINKICTLGRGGSDFTAALIGAALKAKEIQIWTDTDGVLTGDPRIITHPQSISQMSFEEGQL